VSTISGGDDSALALLKTGTVVGWGAQGLGRLGNGQTSGGTDVPTQVEKIGGGGNLTGATAVSMGDDNGLALLSNGQVAAWGADNEGQLGDGGSSGEPTPVAVIGVGGVGVLSNVTAISAGDQHGEALLSNGTVVTWGTNEDGELGDGTGIGDPATSATPVAVPGLTDVVAIAAGNLDDYALRSDGTLWAWGGGGYLGNGGEDDVDTPTQVTQLGDGVTQISTNADTYGALALAQGVPSLSASGLSFGTEPQNELGPTHSITLTNSGAPGLLETYASTSGADPDDFVISDDGCLGRPLATGGSCKLDYRFAPSSAAGTAESATLTIGTNGSKNPTVSLSGTAGAAPTGTTGATGATGKPGPLGPFGKVELVTCKTVTVTVKKKKHKKQKCTAKLVSGPVKFTTSSARATLSRDGRVYAKGTAIATGRGGWQLWLSDTRALRPGRYRLSVRMSRRTRRSVVSIS